MDFSVAILSNGIQNNVVADIMQRRYKYTIPVIDEEQANQFDLVMYECTYDYSCSYAEFLDKQTLSEEMTKRLREGTAGFVINICCEGYIDVIFDLYRWADRRGFPRRNIVYITGAMGATDINDLICQKFPSGRDRISIVRLLHCEWYNNLGADYRRVVRFSDLKLEKKFLCLNRVDKFHRRAMVSYLIKNKISDSCYISYIGAHKVDHSSKVHTLEGLLNEEDLNSVPIPLFLDYTELEPGSINDVTPTQESTISAYFRSSVFSIVNETFQENRWSKFNDLPVIFPTDKTYKTFFFHHIPILNSGHHLVKYFRDSGFDMFDDIVDHSYDNIIDSSDRFRAVCFEIDRLNQKYSIQDLTDLREKIKPRLEDNQDRLIKSKGNFFNVTVTDFQKALNEMKKKEGRDRK